jgi:hypothetical protein
LDFRLCAGCKADEQAMHYLRQGGSGTYMAIEANLERLQMKAVLLALLQTKATGRGSKR